MVTVFLAKQSSFFLPGVLDECLDLGLLFENNVLGILVGLVELSALKSVFHVCEHDSGFVEAVSEGETLLQGQVRAIVLLCHLFEAGFVSDLSPVTEGVGLLSVCLPN